MRLRFCATETDLDKAGALRITRRFALSFVDGVPNRAARTDAGSALAWIAARTFGVVVAIVLEPMANNGSIVKMDQHVRTPLRMSLITDLAMKKADRRGDM